MAEIRALNLGGQQYDPMRGVARPESNVSWSEKQRRNSEMAMRTAVHKYKIKGMERAEKDYILNKKAENYVFGNYPTGRKASLFKPDSLDFLSEGSRSKKLEEWKKNVGGNLQAFEQYYQAGKQAELSGIKRSLIRNRKKYSEDGWKRYVTEYMNNMDPAKRQELMSQLDDETLALVNQYYTPEDFLTLGEKWDRFEYGSPKASAAMKGAGAIAGAVGTGYLAYRALRRGKIPKIGGGGAGGELRDMGLRLGSGKGSSSISKEAQKLLGPGAKAWNMPAKAGGSPIVNPAGQLGLNPARVTLVDDIINPNQMGAIQKGITKGVKDGKITQQMGDQLRGVIVNTSKSGQPFTSRNIWKNLEKLGDKGGAVRQAIEGKKDLDLGPIKGLGMVKTLGATIAAGAVADQLGSGAASALGVGEHNADLIGEASGAVAGTATVLGAPHIYKKVQDVVRRKGAPYILKRVLEKGGAKLAAKVAAKGVLSGIVGTGTLGIGTLVTAGWVASDLYNLYDILKDIE